MLLKYILIITDVLHFRLQKQNGIITNEKGQKTDL